MMNTGSSPKIGNPLKFDGEPHCFTTKRLSFHIGGISVGYQYPIMMVIPPIMHHDPPTST